MKPIPNGGGKVLTAPQWARLWPPRHDQLESAELEMNDREEDDAASSAPEGLKRRSVVLMIVLVIVTLGLYYPIWILRTRRGLNNLNASGTVGATASVVLLALYLVWVPLQFGTAVLQMSGNAEQLRAVKTMETVLCLATSILQLFLTFRIKHMLEEHLLRMTCESSQLSAILTSTLSIFYLQRVINTRLLVQANQEWKEGVGLVGL
jgi:hypothetical protein